jgi:hypothetical protein
VPAGGALCCSVVDGLDDKFIQMTFHRQVKNIFIKIKYLKKIKDDRKEEKDERELFIV